MTNKEKKICTMTQTACGSSDCRTFFPDGKFQEPVEKRSLLLHSCCGPCSTAVVERLAEEFNVTVFFYNPCITDQEEYLRRRSAQIQFLEKFNEENIGKTRVLYKEGDYRPGSFYERTKGHESDPEGGARCLLCFRQRLEKTAETASLSGHEIFGTTLSVSPHKNYKAISEIGCQLALQYGLSFLDRDFKKKNGFGRSVELSKNMIYTGRITVAVNIRKGRRRQKMGKLQIPENYTPVIDYMESQRAIKKIKDFFQQELAYGLQLRRVSAPLFVAPETGLNDNLNGVERTVSFTVKDMGEKKVEIVQSLAKWKRMALGKYNFKPGTGLYTDMNAIRRDEELDNLHSIYVDQWDWEKVITKEDRTEEYLEETVTTLYNALKNLNDYVNRLYRNLRTDLPNEIFFITSQELEDLYPDKTPKEREDAITKEKKAVFIKKIGGVLKSGEKHDGRAPDYDDWELNGDILLWNDILGHAFEISSMGIRVDETAMDRQLTIAGADDRRNMEFHKMILNKELPYTIGGGIGQSRLCMYFLRKAHIGEVQASIWSDDMIKECRENNIFLL